MRSFNPHPSRRTGATDVGERVTVTLPVSILTRPGGRVQPAPRTGQLGRTGFQSSPVPEDGCNRGEVKMPMEAVCFNPHPSRRTGATYA